jgi:hypothetical protein
MRPLILVCWVAAAAGTRRYSVEVTERALGPGGGPLISFANGSSAFRQNLNPAWIPLGREHPGGALFVRVSHNESAGSQLAFVRATDAAGLAYEYVDQAKVLPTPSTAMDPRALCRPSGECFVTYQLAVPDPARPPHRPWGTLRKTFIASTRTPLNATSWRAHAAPMFPVGTRIGGDEDCGTILFFNESAEATARADGSGAPRALAVVTFGGLRGGNLSLAASFDEGLQTWEDRGVFLRTRPGRWDNATLSAGPAPQRLSDGSWLVLYNVDNKWPVGHPKPMPAYGRCALGWAVMDGAFERVLARADAPLVVAQLPWELEGFTAKTVYTDGVRAEGADTFTVFAGGADTVVEAFRIKVRLPRPPLSALDTRQPCDHKQAHIS